ncbi:MAG: glycosyltransferase family 2 protein [Agriterribacter sp.]
MLLSVIIVNHNVKYFLEYCLRSVLKAGAGMDMEVIVADNHSNDNSRNYLPPLFPGVQFIWLDKNEGFSRANNIALKQARGEFILFLNPDTIVPEDCFDKCIAFLASHSSAGAMGVRMINGRGVFLKESKRGFPSLLVSFFKFSGMARLFPTSKLFAYYYLGHLPENEENKVEVLSGAFMLVKAKVLAVTGGFDEAFFMYGEDIDLSYRIQNSGFSNYYYPGTTIIHFKGESTAKASSRYVRTFYNAMQIFVRKHYRPFQSFIYRCLVNMAMLTSIAVNAFKNAFSKNAHTENRLLPETTTTFLVAGIEDECKSVEQILLKEESRGKKIKVEKVTTAHVPATETARELVLCEGKQSFKEIIHTLSLLPLQCRVWFYSTGSKILITGNPGNGKGATIPAD